MIESPGPELFAPESGWTPLQMPRSFGKGRSFVSGHPDGEDIRIHYFHRESDQALMAKVWFGWDAEGPPGHAHGGSMAAVLDECMGFSCWANGHPVVAATITINFRRSLPLHHIYIVEAKPVSVEGVKVYTEATLLDPATGTLFSDATGLFIIQPLDRFGEFIPTRKP